jgi:hypothetical protein
MCRPKAPYTFWRRDLWKGGYERDRPARSQSRQSARLFLQSSELGLPQPLTHRRVRPLPLWFRGWEHTRLWERGGVPIWTSGQTLWYSRYICTLWARLKLKIRLGGACTYSIEEGRGQNAKAIRLDQNGTVSNQLTDIGPNCERVSIMYFYQSVLVLRFTFTVIRFSYRNFSFIWYHIRRSVSTHLFNPIYVSSDIILPALCDLSQGQKYSEKF